MQANLRFEVLSNEKLRNEYDIELKNQEQSNINYVANDFYQYASNRVNENSSENDHKNNYRNSFHSEFYNSHIKPTEDFMSEKFDNLKSRQKIIVFLAFLFIICVMIFFTFLDYLKFVPSKKEIEKEDYPNNFIFVEKTDVEDVEFRQFST